MKNKYDSLYNDLNIEIGKMVAKNPNCMNKPETVFEKASHIKLPEGVHVELLKAKPNHIDIVLPPSPQTVKKLQEKNDPLTEHFASLFMDPKANPKKSKITLQQAISSRAWGDIEFMKKLKKAPKETLSEALHKKLPDNISVKVYEDTLDKLYVAVPPTTIVGGELGEAELRGVAGGAGFIDDVVDIADRCISAYTSKEWWASVPKQVNTVIGDLTGYNSKKK